MGPLPDYKHPSTGPRAAASKGACPTALFLKGDYTIRSAMRRINLPDDIAEPLGRLLQALKDLRAATGRRFTLDGVALGDLGEVVAERLYGVHLHASHSTKGSDGIAPEEVRRVEVKITQKKAVSLAAHSTL